MSDEPQGLQSYLDLQKLAMRPARYASIDGGSELGHATFLLCCALSMYMVVLLPNSLWGAGAGALLLIVAVLAPRSIPKAIKGRVTWPRTGYVAYRFPKWGMVLVLVICAGVSFGLIRLIMPAMREAMGEPMGPPAAGERGYFGIMTLRMTPADARAAHLPEETAGVRVAVVVHGSKAEAARVKPGDVILAFNGKRPTDPLALEQDMADTPPGTTVFLRILRGEPEQTPIEYTIPASMGWVPKNPLVPTKAGPMTSRQRAVLGFWLLLSVAAIAAYGCRNAIRKHLPWLATGGIGKAADWLIPWWARGEAPTGRRGLATFRATLVMPLLGGGLIVGLMYLNAAAAHPGKVRFLHPWIAALLVASNAIMYLRGAGGSITRYPWKWLLSGLMVLVPLAIGAVVTGNFLEQMRPLTLFLGLAWLISGGATLLSYLRHTQPPAPEPA